MCRGDSQARATGIHMVPLRALTHGSGDLVLASITGLGQGCIWIDPTPTGSTLQVVVNNTPGPPFETEICAKQLI